MANPQPTTPATPKRDLTGRRFGKWAVIRAADRPREHWRWLCQCDCGVTALVWADHLMRGRSKSCGCVRDKATAERSLTHGNSRPGRVTPEYRAWCYIITRCTNPNAKSYRYYGARGITICDTWRNSFEAFLADVGPRPSDKHSIDRIDVQKGYEPGNVRWATKTEQMRNTRRNRYLTADGRTQCVAAWAEETGLPPKLIGARLRLGWSESRAVLTPKKSR